ncbi:hypothetical protein [Caenimonas sp. SL110]|uniref:hypothetical protein n=1 Tax=Caenimonas sp. SL110 TaxID=1450524 RepID=UPI00137927A2|nr:hypothetical protein [Caenimonas sp. SL110]
MEWLEKLFNWLREVWAKMSDDDREVMKDAVVAAFRMLLRVFFDLGNEGAAT